VCRQIGDSKGSYNAKETGRSAGGGGERGRRFWVFPVVEAPIEGNNADSCHYPLFFQVMAHINQNASNYQIWI